MSTRRLLSRLAPLPAAAVLLAAAGCSSSDAAATITVPSPSKDVSAMCGKLHEELPDTLAEMDRVDPKPDSSLTAGWGGSAIVLRCGVPRPAKMSDPAQDGVDVNGVSWLLEKLPEGGFRLTTSLRLAYVEVVFGKEYAGDLGPLTDLAGPVKKTIPTGIAD
ncbi:DUF3515 domain-containing protein [Streptomyces sp. NPDC048442]|uniref:DUF3515 domain-containing protein n=1 Tax=Streptomyces sp. NPDC048442 TaxID=3154823 RepID=UPI0034315427